jgi:replicative DNA helicase
MVDADRTAEAVVIDWEPVGGRGGVRIVVTDPASGEPLDIDTADVSRAGEREAVARRLAGRLPQASLSLLKAQLLRIAQERCGLLKAPEERIATLRDAIQEWLRTDSTPVVETGFGPLDSLTGGGLSLGSVNVIAAPPSAGKSAFALQLCLGALSLNPDLRVLWAAGEMSMEVIARRAICRWSADGNSVSMARARERSPASKAVAEQLLASVADRFHILQPPLTADRVESAIKSTKAPLVVIDYLQLVTLSGVADRRAEVDGLVRRVRTFTLEQNTATIVISNVAKGVTGETRIGAISKESSELDFAADTLLFGIADEVQDEDAPYPVRWKVAKNRHGPRRDLETIFDGRFQTFTPAAAEPLEEFANFAPTPPPAPRRGRSPK